MYHLVRSTSTNKTNKKPYSFSICVMNYCTFSHGSFIDIYYIVSTGS